MPLPGPARLDLIRRYARALRELESDVRPASRRRIGARERRLERQADAARSAATSAATVRAAQPTGP